MDKSAGKLDDIGEDVQLASQADIAVLKEDDNVRKIDELLRQLQIQQRLLLEGEVRMRKFEHLKDTEKAQNPNELVDKFLQATVKNEENLQIHMVCQKALETCQYSLALQSVDSNHP